MLNKFFISLSIILFISFTNCGGGSSKEAKELLQKILQFVGIPHSIVVNICQDKNRNGICGTTELFTKLTIQKGDSIDDIWQKISLTPDGRYFLKNVDPSLPILVEFQDELKVNQNDGNFTLEFNAFKNQEQNETKEISILEAMVDADALTKTEADKFRTLKNTESQAKYYATLLNDLETNINTLRANGLDNKKAVIASIKEMGEETKSNQEQADKINGCENNQTCVNERIKKISDELIITEGETLEIIDNKKLTPISVSEKVYGKWVKPSKSSCESSGGIYNSHGKNDCQANWKNANTICQAIGDSLPNIEILGADIIDCGGDLVNHYNNNWEEKSNRNRANELYQSCYKKRGFTSSSYWSSTTSVSDRSDAWGLNFDDGVKYWSIKTYGIYVRCIRIQ